MKEENLKPRWDWVDSARGLGIILVFYGHVLHRGFAPRNESVLDQFRFIYSFHMPLFFLISGFFFKPARDVVARVRELAVRRLLPVAFFNVLLLPLWWHAERLGHARLLHDAYELGLDVLAGRPELNWVTWFLVCLFVCEIAALVVLPALERTGARLAFGLGSIALGVLVCNRANHASGGIVPVLAHAWFADEAVVALGFYAIGSALWPAARWLCERRGAAAFAVVAFAAFALAVFPANVVPGGVVMLSAGVHGDVLAFVAMALAGAGAVVALAIALPPWSWLRWLGQQSLPLLGLNGLFFHYVNPKLAHLWHTPASPLGVLGVTAFATALSLLACVPVVRLMNRWVPRLVGRPAGAGSRRIAGLASLRV